MPFVSKIEARAYVRTTEVFERVVSAVLSIFPEHLRQSVLIESSKAEGQVGDTITIVSGALDGEEDCEAALDYLFGQMDRQSRRIIERSLDIRLDDQCIFFLRIDKQAAFQGLVRMANGQDVISVKLYFKHYPRCKPDEVLLVIEEKLKTAGGAV
jgi:RNA binding exosome subunit